MFYFCLAFSLLWLIIFAYVFALDRQIRDIGRRLDARTSSSEQQ
ncbi:MAG: CcmD family protein [Planctomycetota bacterium]|jgi:CcmD family protein